MDPYLASKFPNLTTSRCGSQGEKKAHRSRGFKMCTIKEIIVSQALLLRKKIKTHTNHSATTRAT
jgi:hypothetical protein